MSGFDGFIGNEKLILRLKRDIRDGRLSHSYIIEGKKGTGKRTLARLICAAVSCLDDSACRPCMKCTACDKIMREQSPDVIYVTPEQDRVQLGVDVIRRMREDAVFAPNELPAKFYIFPDADAMNNQAQNAFLKILEEPPPNVMFLLLSEDSEKLLATIRSRAPTLRLELLSDEELEMALEKNPAASRLKSGDNAAYLAAIKLAHGSLGRAIELCDPKQAAACLELYEKAERYIELLASRKTATDELAFYEYASKLVAAKQREKLAQIFELLSDAARDLCTLKLARSARLIFWVSEQKAVDMSDKFALSSLMRLVEIFMEARDSLEYNANLNLIQARCAAAAASVGRRNANKLTHN